MTGWMTVFELRGTRWHVIAGTTCEAEAVRVARMRAGIYCRPMCVAPDGVHPDAAFPVAARVVCDSAVARVAAFTRARRAA